MRRFHIMLPTLVREDAVGNDAFMMRDALVKAGFEARLYAENVGSGVTGVEDPDRFLDYGDDPSDTLVYHFSIGWDKGLYILGRTKARKIIKYHNITPPEFFTPYSRELFNLCSEGRKKLAEIAKMGCDLYLSDSGFNSRELTENGAPGERCSVVPPFNNVEKMAGLDIDMDAVERYADGKVNILMVGRIAPNKGHKRLIETFAYYHYEMNSGSRLIIAGGWDPRLEKYNNELRKLVRKLGLTDSVIFTGRVSDSTLKTLYITSHAMLMASHHEGFCVPLAEAMYFGLPIIAYGSSAVPETLGGDALYWDSEDKFYYAVSLAEVVKSPDAAERLASLQHERFIREYSAEAIGRKFLEAVL